ASSATTTFTGNLSGPGGFFTNKGTGRIVVSGTNSLTKASVIAFGTYEIDGSQPKSPITMLAGTITGDGTSGPIMALDVGTITPGGSTPGVLTVNGGLDLSQAQGLTIASQVGNSAHGYDQLAVTGGSTNLGSGANNLAVSLSNSSPIPVGT